MATKLTQMILYQFMMHEKTLREMGTKLIGLKNPEDAPSKMHIAQHLHPMMDINQNQ